MIEMLKNKLLLSIILSTYSILMLTTTGYAQPDKNSFGYAWTKSKLLPDSPVTRATRSAVDGASAAQLEKKIDVLRKEVADDKSTAAERFEYASTAYRLVIKHKKPKLESDLLEARRAMQNSPVSSEVSHLRIRFLIAARQDAFAPTELTKLGIALADKDSTDYDVRYYTCKLLKPDLRPDEKQIGVKLCQEMAKIAPNRSSLHSMWGSIYFRSWLKSHSKSDAEKGIVAYQKFLQLAPAADPFRPQAKQYITMMQKK